MGAPEAVSAEPALPLAERVLLLGALAALALLAWAYLVHHATMPMGRAMAHGGADFVLLGLMWMVMMPAMMLPSVAPTVLVHAAVSRRMAPASAVARNAAFIGGYAAAWSAYALGAAGLQLALGHLTLLAPEMRSSSPLFGAALLAAAGAWQLTPVKDACLRQCRTPLQFVAEHWRDGAAGALRMGAWHGLYCIGCCGVLMALLFVVGVMNLLWVTLIAVFVVLEKTAFPGTAAGRWISGAGLLAAAVLLFFGG